MRTPLAYALLTMLCGTQICCREGLWYPDSVENLVLSQSVSNPYYTLLVTGQVGCACAPARSSMVVELWSQDRALARPIVAGFFAEVGAFELAGSVEANETLTVQVFYVTTAGMIHSTTETLRAPDKPPEGVASVALQLHVP